MSYSSVILAEPSLVSLWKLDELSGTSAADAKDSNTGVYNGGYTQGASGYGPIDGTAVTFGGSTGYVDVPNSANLQLTNVTMEALIKTSQTSEGHFVGKRSAATSGWAMRVSNGHIGVWCGDTATSWITTLESFNDNLWHHVAGTISSGTVSLYVDSNLLATTAVVPSLSNSGILAIGRDAAASQFYFNGSVDNVAIYNAVLPLGSIQNHYQAITETGSIRLTQYPVEALITPSGHQIRVTQDAVRTLLVPSGQAVRLTQNAVKTILSPSGYAVRLTQAAVRVLTPTPPVNLVTSDLTFSAEATVRVNGGVRAPIAASMQFRPAGDLTITLLNAVVANPVTSNLTFQPIAIVTIIGSKITPILLPTSRVNTCGFETLDQLEINSFVSTGLTGPTTRHRTGQGGFLLDVTAGNNDYILLGGISLTTGYYAPLTVSQAYMRFYAYIDSYPSSDSMFFWVQDSVGHKVTVRLTQVGHLKLYDNTELVLATSIQTVSVGVWTRIELFVSVSTCELRIEGDVVYAGVASLGTGLPTYFGWGVDDAHAEAYSFVIDDISIDSEAFPGPGEIFLLLAVGDGYYQGWVPAPPDLPLGRAARLTTLPYDWTTPTPLQARFVATEPIPGDAFTMTMQALTGAAGGPPSFGGVASVKTLLVASSRNPADNTGSDHIALKSRLRSTGVDSDFNVLQTLVGHFNPIARMYVTDPATAATNVAWTVAGVNQLELGAEQEDFGFGSVHAILDWMKAVFLSVEMRPGQGLGVTQISFEVVFDVAGDFNVSILRGSQITSLREEFNAAGDFSMDLRSVFFVTSTFLSVAPNPFYVGDVVTFTAVVTSPDGIPAGTVTFYVDGVPIGTASVDGTGVATFQTNTLTSGPHTALAIYSGDSAFGGSTSNTVVLNGFAATNCPTSITYFNSYSGMQCTPIIGVNYLQVTYSVTA